MAKPLKHAVTEPELREMILKASTDSMTSWARENGVTPQGVSSFLHQKQPAGLKIPAVFGLVPITVFVPEGHDLHFTYPSRTAKPAEKLAEPVEKKRKKDKKRKKGKK